MGKGVHLTGRVRHSTGIVVAGACLTLAACGGGGTPAPGTPSSPAVTSRASSEAQSSPPPDIPSALAAPKQPTGPCPYVTQGQVEKALGQRVEHFKGCVYSFANGAGSVGISTYTYNSEALARECLAQQNRTVGPGSSSRPIPDLGPSAESVVLPKEGTVATLLRGAKWIAVGIIWPQAASHPELAVTLLRDAAPNFNSYSNTPQQEC